MELAEHVVFRIADASYAIPVRCVREIVEAGPMTRVPSAPPYVRGVTNLRGTVLPVIDLAVKFGMAECAITRRTCVIAVELETDGITTLLGVLADSVTDVMSFGPENLEPPPAFGTHVDTAYLTALGRLGDEFVLVLNVERLLSAAELTTPLKQPDATGLSGVAGPSGPATGTA